MRIVTFAEPCGKCGVNEILPQAGGLRDANASGNALEVFWAKITVWLIAGEFSGVGAVLSEPELRRNWMKMRLGLRQRWRIVVAWTDLLQKGWGMFWRNSEFCWMRAGCCVTVLLLANG